MNFFDKLDLLLKDAGIKDQNLFMHWVMKQVQLELDENAMTAEQASHKILLNVSHLSETDLKKLLLFFNLPESTVPIENRIELSDQFLSETIFPQFEEYVKSFTPNKTEIQNPEQISTLLDEADEDFTDIDDFILIDSNGEQGEEIDYESYPWLDPNHPLYFPATQTTNPTSSTRWEAVDKFSVENWYPHLKKYTFESCFFSLDHEDIQFLIGNSSSEYQSIKLEQTFDKLLSQFKNQEVFMRLSTRSPKDSRYLFDEAETMMSNDYSYWKNTDNKNQQLVSFVASMAKSMKITSGKKIIQMIQESPRVQNDLFALLNSESPPDCKTNIVLREWYNIRPDHEFRLFVSRRCRQESIVTAISQYFHFLYFDKAPGDCFNFLDEAIKKSLILKFQNYVLKSIDPAVAKFLNFSSEQDDDNSINCTREYIVDLALIPISEYHGEVTDENKIEIGESTYILMVIELNPFAPSATGCGLFNWQKDLDILWGKAPCEYPIYRFRTEPRENLSSVTLLPSNYEQVIERALVKRFVASLPSVDSQVSPSVGTASHGSRFFTSPHQQIKDTTPLERVSDDMKCFP
ncbi:hypothetical protein Lsan_3176 [Legionella santicrucis]|uniref:D123 n=1 Tax=Legionella santicrucis TaxID=45074 RepID=A0A0W0YF89_9GAMM|nr:hypothetical protein [Legionella santicrucis]KTD55624.1 hypothetical protein Lsan_3176 [Legionella santicrucis]